MCDSGYWFSLSSVGCVWFPFLLIPELHNTFRGQSLGFKYLCLSVSSSPSIHKQPLGFLLQLIQTNLPRLQTKTNIYEIKLGRKYLISELNVWIKLGFLHWMKPVSIGSMSSIWENRRRKTFSFFCVLPLFFDKLFIPVSFNLFGDILILISEGGSIYF